MKKSETTRENIPQILALTRITKGGNVSLRKAIRQHLGLNGNRTLYLDTSHEILITPDRGSGKRIVIDDKNRISLPDVVLEKLQITKDPLIGLVERGRGLAIKSFRIREKKGESATRSFSVNEKYLNISVEWHMFLIEKMMFIFCACPTR